MSRGRGAETANNSGLNNNNNNYYYKAHSGVGT